MILMALEKRKQEMNMEKLLEMLGRVLYDRRNGMFMVIGLLMAAAYIGKFVVGPSIGLLMGK